MINLKEAWPTEYPRHASSDRSVMLDTQHEPSGNLNIPEGQKTVKNVQKILNTKSCKALSAIGQSSSKRVTLTASLRIVY